MNQSLIQVLKRWMRKKSVQVIPLVRILVSFEVRIQKGVVQMEMFRLSPLLFLCPLKLRVFLVVFVISLIFLFVLDQLVFS